MPSWFLCNCNSVVITASHYLLTLPPMNDRPYSIPLHTDFSEHMMVKRLRNSCTPRLPSRLYVLFSDMLSSRRNLHWIPLSPSARKPVSVLVCISMLSRTVADVVIVARSETTHIWMFDNRPNNSTSKCIPPIIHSEIYISIIMFKQERCNG